MSGANDLGLSALLSKEKPSETSLSADLESAICYTRGNACVVPKERLILVPCFLVSFLICYYISVSAYIFGGHAGSDTEVFLLLILPLESLLLLALLVGFSCILYTLCSRHSRIVIE